MSHHQAPPQGHRERQRRTERTQEQDASGTGSRESRNQEDFRGEGVPFRPSAPSLHSCFLTSNPLSWERTGCLSKEVWGRGLSRPRRPGSGAGRQPGPQASLPPARCCSGAGPAHPLGTNKQETDTNLVLAPSAWPLYRGPASPQSRNLSTKKQSSQRHKQNQAQRYGFWKTLRLPHLETTRFYLPDWQPQQHPQL